MKIPLHPCSYSHLRHPFKDFRQCMMRRVTPQSKTIKSLFETTQNCKVMVAFWDEVAHRWCRLRPIVLRHSITCYHNLIFDYVSCQLKTSPIPTHLLVGVNQTKGVWVWRNRYQNQNIYVISSNSSYGVCFTTVIVSESSIV